MAVHNAYPDLPEIAFLRTQVTMPEVIAYMKTTASPTPVKRACYVIFRNESGNGKKGVNNNYVGLQADGNRVADKWVPLMAGTCVHAENTTGNVRRFVCFKDWHTSIDFLSERIADRGLFVGGTTHLITQMHINAPDDWALAYRREWVMGDKNATLPTAEKAGLLSMYKQAEQNFP